MPMGDASLDLEDVRHRSVALRSQSSSAHLINGAHRPVFSVSMSRAGGEWTANVHQGWDAPLPRKYHASSLTSLLDAAVGDYPARVVAVGVDRDCPAEQIAAATGTPSYRVAVGDYPDRPAWDAAIADAGFAAAAVGGDA